ncbi:hypothetical protein Q9K02_10480 [Qipengyuania sp. G39]|jgi:hypothetical protein|uniref:Uncharacterized protein n=1 Tax=Qipengyuania profundimaris TaxID=3067652 RepID=A0ABT9HR15_9SPHN|nr:hypothetical protein [Qipengyuania sp. G39]MDP4575562.1 hypothetical protein [Qipengyuania sp. G39]
MSNPENDPTKPTPNSEKFKPQNVQDPLKDRAPTEKRGAPGDTEGYDVAHGSQPTTKSTPSA